MNIDALVYWKEVSLIALTFPGAVEASSYGTPAFKVNKKLFARLKEDGKTLVLYTFERDSWMKQNPKTFFITDHYKDHPLMLIDLASVKKKDLKTLMLDSWKLRAPAKLLRQMN
ncbi:MAG: MmcQ/YjbR family DNA-binding protein [Bacteroidota bacterium]